MTIKTLVRYQDNAVYVKIDDLVIYFRGQASSIYEIIVKELCDKCDVEKMKFLATELNKYADIIEKLKD